MKRLVILAFSLLLFAGCQDKGSGEQNSVKGEQFNYTNSGKITHFGSSKEIGRWRYDASKKMITISMNRAAINGTPIDGTSQLVVASHLLSLEYLKKDADGFLPIGSLFADSLTTQIPDDVECGFGSIEDLVMACLNLALYDSTGRRVAERFGDLLDY